MSKKMGFFKKLVKAIDIILSLEERFIELEKLINKYNEVLKK
jgi:hypothetical protein